jgi:hypothetical protein
MHPFITTGWCAAPALEILGRSISITSEAVHTWINSPDRFGNYPARCRSPDPNQHLGADWLIADNLQFS